MRVVSLHPGVSFEEVQEATGFALERGALSETPMPTAEQLAIIAGLDPHNVRATVIRDNPTARKSA
jgi:glutaconate CoA-transferase subunit B